MGFAGFGRPQGDTYSQSVSDIRAEPNSVPIILMSMSMEIFRNISPLMASSKISMYSLLALKGQLRVMHAFTRTRSHIHYNEQYKELQKKLTDYEADKNNWGDEATKDDSLKYFDILMNWFDLEVTLFERFNLVPAEDEEIVWPDIDYKAIGLEKYA
jgi:hypothetical protein